MDGLDDLTPEQRANMREQIALQASLLRKANAEKAVLQAVNEALRNELKGVRQQIEKGQGMIKPAQKKRIESDQQLKGYMKKSDYQKALIRLGVITLQPGAPDEGQHVFHIIASSNGGPDHVRRNPPQPLDLRILPRPGSLRVL